MNAQTPQIQIFQNQQEEEDINLKDCWAVFKRSWWLILLGLFIVIGLIHVYLVRTPRQYEATAVVKLPTSDGGGLARAFGDFLPVGPENNVATEIEIIKSRDMAERVIRKLELDKRKENLEREWRQIVSGLQGMLKVQQRGRMNLIEITAMSNSPEEAKNIANEVAIVYIEQSNSFRQETWKDLISYLEVELEKTAKDLGESRQRLYNHAAREGIMTAFSSLLGGDKYVVPEVPQAIAGLKASIMRLEIQLEMLRENLSEANPEIINLKGQIVVSRQRLQQEEKKAIEKHSKYFDSARVAAEVVFNQQLYGILVSKQQELKAQYIIRTKSPEMVEKALEPLYPSKPKRKLILMLGAVLGLFLGLGAALFRALLDNSIYTTQDVTKELDLPVLGSIPRLRAIKNNPRSALITYYHASSSLNLRAREFYKESYKMLQLEVMAAVDGKVERAAGPQYPAPSTQHQGARTLLVTSSISEEGKSMVAANLAIAIVQTGRKVLLVDADCRNSAQHKLLALDSHTGLIDILTGNAAWSEVVKKTSVDNLNAITYGSEGPQLDPSALLISSHLESFINLSKGQFDVIIFDSPSATLASESAAIGSKVDGVVLVIKANDTKRDIILQAKQRIQNSGGNILGAVLNCATV